MTEYNKTPIKPTMDIKQYEGGERFSINYDGEIQIITLNYYNKLKREAQRAIEFENELELSKLKYLTKISKLEAEIENGKVEQQRLRNRLEEQERKFEKRVAVIKSNNNRMLSDKDKQLKRIEGLLNRQGKGRPVVLTNNHKRLIEHNLRNLKVAGRKGGITIKDIEAHLVQHMGYTGGYEPVRAYVSELLKGHK